MKKLISDYFYFTKRERNGVVLLVIIALIFIELPGVVRKFRTVEKYEFEEFRQVRVAATPAINNAREIAPEAPVDFAKLNPQSIDPNFANKEAFLNLGVSPKLVNTILNYRNKGGKFYNAESLKKIYGMTEVDYQRILPYIVFKSAPKQSQRKSIPNAVNQQTQTTTAPVIIQSPSQKFDPNIVAKEELLSLGLPEKIVNRMIKFRDAGGKFRAPQDLENVYGMKEAWVEQLLPWMEIAKPAKIDPEKTNFNKKKEKKKENPITDINTANFEDWQNLIGIGPYYADKIMGYREKLGGFTSIDQVLETNGLPDSIKQSILPALRTSDIFRKLKINSSSTKEMATHPYITWKEANAISNYRKQHGPFDSRADLEKMLALQPEFIDRIFPYLDFTKSEN